MKTNFLLAMTITIATLLACKKNHASGEVGTEDSVSVDVPVEQLFLPDTVFQSVEILKYTTEYTDSLPHPLTYVNDLYADSKDIRTFRKNLSRIADFQGTVNGNPTKIEVAWTFQTRVDTRATKFGTWAGGSGWSGQPLYVHWTPEEMNLFKKHSKALTEDFTDEEIMVGSLCNYVYFINFNNGKISREPIDVKNVIKGTMSLDPEMKNLYVGQGVPHEQPFGNICIDLLTHDFKYIIPSANGAWRSWNAFDSSAIVAGGYLFWCSENGTVYKFEREQGNLKLIATFKYRVNGAAPGIESSICIYRNYGYFTDNGGNLICLNLNTMKPVWYYYNHDDSDGSTVCKEENGIPFIYTGCEVDKQGDKADWHFVKLNAINGEKVWEATKPCQRLHIGAKTLDGGMYSTALMGSGDCEGMIFANICRNNAAKNQGELVALNTKDGKEIYSTGYNSWAWSSPVAFHNENAQMYIFTGDASGNVYLIKAKTGEIIYKEHVANNFESSPIAVGNSAIVGSRGNGIYKFEIK